MKKQLFYLLVILFIALLIGCKKNNIVSYNVNSSQNLIPLEKGNTWYYSGIVYDTLGTIKDNYSLVYDVRGDTIIFGKKLTPYSGYYVTNTDSGLLAFGGYSLYPAAPYDTVVHYYLLYKYPAKTGDRFDQGRRVGTLDTVIVVPAGSYHCIRYMLYYDNVLLYEDYISPGVGLIKSVYYFAFFYSKNPSAINGFIELKSYKLN
jgi:hypothetical protein